MDTTVYLIRHGHIDLPITQGEPTIYGPEVLLSSIGRQQMRNLGQKLSKQRVKFDEIYTSPLLRARQSAYLVSKEVGNPPILYVDGLRGLKYPTWRGRPVSELKSEEEIFTDESLREVSERIWKTFQELVLASSNKTIGIVMHGEESGVLLHQLTNPEQDAELGRSMGNGEATRLVVSSELRLKEKQNIIPYEIKVGKERA